MTRRKPRILTIEQADAAMKSIAPYLHSNGYPAPEVRKVLQIVAFQRGQIEQLKAELARMNGGEPKKPGFADRLEQGRK